MPRRAAALHASERFWSKVARRGPDDCWEWQAGRSMGYGILYVGGHYVRSHVVVHLLAHGTIPPGLLVLHTCDNRLCCNPAHIYAGTHIENAADARRNGRLRRSRFSDEEVRAIRAAVARGVSKAALARQHGVSRAWIRKIASGQGCADAPGVLTPPEHRLGVAA